MSRIIDLLGGSAIASLMLASLSTAAFAAEGPLSLSKECSKFTAHSGDFCSITESSLAAIPAGSKVFYYGPVIGPAILSTYVVLDAGGDSTAIGYCNVELAKSSGTCTFWAGSGALTGFQAIVTLTIDGTASSVHAEIVTASVDTSNATRDKGELQTAGFLNGAAFPVITFDSTSIEPTGEQTGKITGNLSMAGVTVPVTIDTSFNGEAR